MSIFFAVTCLSIFVSSNGNVGAPKQEAATGCRSERQTLLPVEVFQVDACARCYRYMPSIAFHFKLQYNSEEPGVLRDLRTNVTHLVNPTNISDALLETFVDESFTESWLGCCRAALDCCHSMVNTPLLSSTGGHCPRTWDGWQCWPDTPAGTFAQQPCQAHVYLGSTPPPCSRTVQKECLSNGTWFRLGNMKEYANYTTCGRKEEHKQFLSFHIATYVISIISLTPALLIFLSYKQLQVPRIAMHKNLFLSLLLHGLILILFKTVVIADDFSMNEGYKTVIERNGSGCKILLILTKYFRMTNYMWMFCEGFYLQKLIAATFAEQRSLLIFYIIGWVLPIIPVGLYGILRATLANEDCWAFPVEIFEWIIYVPDLLALLLNLVFLCNIIRVLVTKLRATHAHEPSQYRKAVRATLVLIPLFGLHFCLVIYRPHAGKCGWVQAYFYFHYAMDGLQGFMVALLFCYLNGEVIYLLGRTYERFKLHNEFRSRKNSAIMRRWSTTLTTVNDSHNGHHKHRDSGHHKPDAK